MTLYDVLSIDKEASLSQIKMAYRKLALKYHPDKNPSPEAKEIFRKISNAYDILSDPEKRKQYDFLGENVDLSELGTEGFDPIQMFQDMLDRENDTPNVYGEVKVSLEDLYTGCQIKKTFSRFTLCIKCNGKGTRDGKDHSCDKCKGQGELLVEAVIGAEDKKVVTEECTVCEGKGIDPSVKTCKKCKGNVCSKEKIKVLVDIPPGAYDGYVILIEGKGNSVPKSDRLDKIKKGEKMNKRSDLEIVVVEKQHEKFLRDVPQNLMYEMDIEFIESICGFRRKIKHLSGQKLVIVHKEPIGSGDYLVLKKKGMPYIDKKGKGDMFIHINVRKPSLDKKQIRSIWKILNDDTNSHYPPSEDMVQTFGLVTLEKYKKELEKKDTK